MSKWFCEDCARTSSDARPNACPACCGFTALDEYAREYIAAVNAALESSPLMAYARTLSAELDESMTVLRDAGAGERS